MTISHRPVKLPPAQRKAQIIALQMAGLTQHQIADKLGVARSTIQEDLKELRPAQAIANSLIDDLNREFDKLQTPASIAQNYVTLATKDANGSVRLTSQDRILEYRGVITEKERFRREKADTPVPTAMFVFGNDVKIALGPTPSPNIEQRSSLYSKDTDKV